MSWLEKGTLYFALVVLLLFIIWILLRNLRREWEEKKFQTYLRRIGTEGERNLLHTLLHLPGYKKVMTNLYLPAKKKGNLTEIDLLLICKKGLFVIESKNYAAWIYGSENEKDWVATFPNGDSFTFYNPILQNQAHIHAIMRVLETDMREYFTSVLVFGDKTVFQDVHLYQTKAVFTRQAQFRRTMKRQMRKTPDYLDKEDIQAIYTRLSAYGNADRNTVKSHIRQMQRDRTH